MLKLRCVKRAPIKAGHDARILPPSAPAASIKDGVVWLRNEQLAASKYRSFFTQCLQEFDEGDFNERSYGSFINDVWQSEVLMIEGKGMLRVVSTSHRCYLDCAISSLLSHRCYLVCAISSLLL